jgi:hypothetical protein
MNSAIAATLLAVACAISPVEDRLPTVIARMSGQDHAWLVDGSSGRWAGVNQVVKSVWVFSRKATGSLRVTGRRLDGEGTLRFQDGYGAQPTDALEIADPWKRSVRPGGATPEILRTYSFIPNYIIYPSPGCWELTVTLGTDSTHIVLDIK